MGFYTQLEKQVKEQIRKEAEDFFEITHKSIKNTLMNLFANETKEFLQRFVSEDWAEVLSEYLSIEAMEGIAKKIKDARENGVVYPDSSDVFKAFKYPFKDVKVVIIGQDPYFNGNADGLAFSCKLNISPSLDQILKAIARDLGVKAYMGNMSLEYLAEQGVFLFNPALTVRENDPGSHKSIWYPFACAVIKALSNKKKDLVWMAWGNDARSIVGQNIDPKAVHLYLGNEHPAFAARSNRAWICDHFSKANKYLKEGNINEINWLK